MKNQVLPGSESSVGPAIKQAVGEAKGRVVLATFASNVSRIQQAIDAAVMFNRKVVVMSRSMVNVTEIAQERGYLNIPPNTIIDVDAMNNYTDDQIMILTTGSPRVNRWQACPVWLQATIAL